MTLCPSRAGRIRRNGARPPSAARCRPPRRRSATRSLPRWEYGPARRSAPPPAGTGHVLGPDHQHQRVAARASSSMTVSPCASSPATNRQAFDVQGDAVDFSSIAVSPPTLKHPRERRAVPRSWREPASGRSSSSWRRSCSLAEGGLRRRGSRRRPAPPPWSRRLPSRLSKLPLPCRPCRARREPSAHGPPRRPCRPMPRRHRDATRRPDPQRSPSGNRRRRIVIRPTPSTTKATSTTGPSVFRELLEDDRAHRLSRELACGPSRPAALRAKARP